MGSKRKSGLTNSNTSFTATVVYEQPDFEELNRRFPTYVDSDYESIGTFSTNVLCKKDVIRETRDITFEYVQLDREESTTEEVFAALDRRDVRPALYEELLAFYKQYPKEVTTEHPIVALGSVAYHRSGPCIIPKVAYLRDWFGCWLDLYEADDKWPCDLRFLVVRSNNESLTAPVVYDQPTLKKLDSWFSFGVDRDYIDKRFAPIPIKSNRVVSRKSREVAFEYVCMDRDASTDAVLVEMDRKGLRPALYEELLGFLKKYPQEKQKRPSIVALGSVTWMCGYYVACLSNFGFNWGLNLQKFDQIWSENDRFLAVPLQVST